MSRYVPPIYSVPKDSEGYIQSFALNEEAAIREFFNKFGFVVIRDVFDKPTCQTTIDDIWSFIESKTDIKRSDPQTWENREWRKTGIYVEGIIGNNPIFTETCLRNRENPRLHKAFSVVLGREDLLVNMDRYGLFRPTRGAKSQDNHDDWKTMANLHLDMNPWSYIEEETPEHAIKVLGGLRYKTKMDFIAENNQPGVMNPKYFELNVQGLVNLADNKEEDGGFQIVPGFREHLQQWAENRPELKMQYGKYQTFIVLPDSEPVQKQSVRVTARAGSAIIWDQRTIHGSRPNNSSNIRYAQFFKMFPSIPPETERAKARSVQMAKILEETNFQPSEFGKKVFGLVPY